MPLKVLVYGYYGKEALNLGDSLFQDAFKFLWPKFEYTFTDHLTAKQVANADVLFVGGGSLLDGRISTDADAKISYRYLPTLYIGVGTETSIHEDHQHMLAKALLVATRTADTTFVHPKLTHCPDLVYSLQANVVPAPTKKLLFLPNTHVVPNHKDAHWKHTLFQTFKVEVSQFLDEVIDRGYQVTFYAMCQNETSNDLFAAAEIRNMMVSKRNVCVSTYQARSFNQALNFFGEFSHVVTQRYHGIVLSDLAARPVVSIFHHDKLKANSSVVPYYGVTKNDLLVQLESAKVNTLNTDFTELKAAVELACATLG